MQNARSVRGYTTSDYLQGPLPSEYYSTSHVRCRRPRAVHLVNSNKDEIRKKKDPSEARCRVGIFTACDNWEKARCRVGTFTACDNSEKARENDNFTLQCFWKAVWWTPSISHLPQLLKAKSKFSFCKPLTTRLGICASPASLLTSFDAGFGYCTCVPKLLPHSHLGSHNQIERGPVTCALFGP